MGWASADDLDAAVAELGATEGYADLRDLRMHYVRMGEGAPVVLLHGFPEYWHSWRNQLPALAQAGYTAIAPDLRGYHRTGTPERGYDIRTLAGDIAGLITALGYEKAHVVGHDWGSAVAWALAMFHPDRVDRLAILDGAHPAAYVRELRTAEQRKRSSYILFFQLPWLPEWLITRDAGLAMLKGVRKAVVNKAAFTPNDMARLLQLWNDGHSLHGGLNYYRGLRALVRDPARGQTPTVVAPTLVLWGEQDPFGTVALTQGLEEWVPNVRVHILPDTGHWIHQERPDEVNRLLLDFLRG